jgi:hypothetical protein
MEGWVFPEDHPKFWEDPVADLSDTDLYFSTFCAADQARQKVTWGQTGGYPTCFFCGQQYRYSVFAVECHFDHTLNKKTCGKDRLCKACPFATRHHVSEHKARFTEVQMAIRSRSQTRKAKDTSTQVPLPIINLVLREYLERALEFVLPWDIELVIDEPEAEQPGA